MYTAEDLHIGAHSKHDAFLQLIQSKAPPVETTRGAFGLDYAKVIIQNVMITCHHGDDGIVAC